MALQLPPMDRPCFVDANVLYYDVVAYPGISEYCTALVKEIMSGARPAVTLASAVADAVHKVMFSEIVEYHHRQRAGLLAWVKKNPDAIKPLTKFSAAAAKFTALPMTWLPASAELLRNGADIAAQHGLTVNDALIVAAMRRHQIEHLVTNDNDFDGIPGITVWKPR